jgi:hypothetical protein
MEGWKKDPHRPYANGGRRKKRGLGEPSYSPHWFSNANPMPIKKAEPKLRSVLSKLTLLSVLAWHEQTQFLLSHILGTINSHLSFQSLNNRFFLSLPMRSAFRVKNDNVVFAKIVTLKIANGTKHSVFLWHSAVASFSSAFGIRDFRVEKFMPAFCATERIDFSPCTVSCH